MPRRIFPQTSISQLRVKPRLSVATLSVLGRFVWLQSIDPAAPCVCGKRLPIDLLNAARAWSTRTPAIWTVRLLRYAASTRPSRTGSFSVFHQYASAALRGFGLAAGLARYCGATSLFGVE